jgi:hypothetical protein
MLLSQENQELDQQATKELSTCRLTNQKETDQRRLANQETCYLGEWQIRRVAFRNLKMGLLCNCPQFPVRTLIHKETATVTRRLISWDTGHWPIRKLPSLDQKTTSDWPTERLNTFRRLTTVARRLVAKKLANLKISLEEDCPI